MIASTKSATVSFLVELSSASINTILSAPCANTAAPTPFKSTDSAEPPPPVKPVPAAAVAILTVLELASKPVPANGVAKSPMFALPSVPPSLTSIKSLTASVADVKSLPNASMSSEVAVIPVKLVPSPTNDPVKEPVILEPAILELLIIVPAVPSAVPTLSEETSAAEPETSTFLHCAIFFSYYPK